MRRCCCARASSGPPQGVVEKERRKGHLAALCIGTPLVTSTPTRRLWVRVRGMRDEWVREGREEKRKREGGEGRQEKRKMEGREGVRGEK